MRQKILLAVLGVIMLLSSCISSNPSAKPKCLRVNFKEEPTTLDPRRGRNLSGASQLHAMMFEGLMRVEPDGTLTNAQASSYEISPDLKTYTFRLGNTFWSDGTPVTAYDFEKTWKDILSPAFPSTDAHLLYCILNANTAKKGELPLESVGIHAKDAKTLVVQLEHPTPHFLQIVASCSLYPINQTQAQRFPNWFADAGEHFVCNGPFRLKKWRHHNEMVLEKNKRYRNADQVQIDAIHVSMIDSESATLHMYESGALDIIGMPISPLPFDAYARLMRKNLLNVFQAPGTMICLFNTKQFPFYNLNMRKAFSYAINRKLLVENVTQLKEDPALRVLSPLLKNTSAKEYFTDGDIENARACFQNGLKELGITPDDLEGKVTFSYWINDHACPMLPQALQQQWKKVLGVDVEIEALEFKAMHEKGKKELFSIGYFVLLPLYHDPFELLDRFRLANSPRNYGRWQNDSYADLVTRSSCASSQEEHFALLDQAEAILMEEMPFAPIFHWNYGMLVQPRVKGFAISPPGVLRFDRVSIEEE